jgi:hypothetical protein
LKKYCKSYAEPFIPASRTCWATLIKEGGYWMITLKRIVNYLLGVLDLLLVFRLIFKLLGANPGSAFVSLLYNISGVFLAPFSGIFRAIVINKGIANESVLEPATIIAMIVYALIAYGVVRLIEIYETRKDKEIQ